MSAANHQATVILSLPPGSGKTRVAAELAQRLDCAQVCDPWEPHQPIQPGALHLTNARLDSVAAPQASAPSPAEADPHGTPAHSPGAKLDAGKPLAGLVLGDFAHALAAVVDVGTFGASKYSPSGWLSVPQGHARYTDAMLRHWLAEASGQALDAQTGLAHAAHLAWNALARLELALRQQQGGQP